MDNSKEQLQNDREEELERLHSLIQELRSQRDGAMYLANLLLKDLQLKVESTNRGD